MLDRASLRPVSRQRLDVRYNGNEQRGDDRAVAVEAASEAANRARAHCSAKPRRWLQEERPVLAETMAGCTQGDPRTQNVAVAGCGQVRFLGEGDEAREEGRELRCRWTSGLDGPDRSSRAPAEISHVCGGSCHTRTHTHTTNTLHTARRSEGWRFWTALFPAYAPFFPSSQAGVCRGRGGRWRGRKGG